MEKRALFCVFKPDRLETSEEMRKQFESSYPIFAEMASVEFKCWWVDQENGEWGAFYIFRSEQELNTYINSERWLKVIPEKYGCKPTWRVLEPALVLSKSLNTDDAG
jgi:hypothetical protein